MSHAIRFLDYHCSTSKKSILKDLNRFAYDPDGCGEYHGNITFHDTPVYKNREEAEEAIKKIPGVEDAVMNFMTQKLTLEIADDANNVREQVKAMRIQAEQEWQKAKEQFEKDLLGE